MIRQTKELYFVRDILSLSDGFTRINFLMGFIDGADNSIKHRIVEVVFHSSARCWDMQNGLLRYSVINVFQL